MIPHRIVGKSEGRPYVTFTLMALMLLVFGWEIWLTASTQTPIEQYLERYSYITCTVGQTGAPELLVDGLRSQFMHLGVAALALNLWFLWMFAPRVEAFLGHRRFAVFYLVAGAAGQLAATIFSGGACSAVVGANAAIAGVMAGFLFLYPGNAVDAFVPMFARGVTLPAFVFLLLYFGVQLFDGNGGAVLSGQVAPLWDELGGALFGFLAMFIATLFQGTPTIDPFERLDR